MTHYGDPGCAKHLAVHLSQNERSVNALTEEDLRPTPFVRGMDLRGIHPRKPSRTPWAALAAQLSVDCSEGQNFKRKVSGAIRLTQPPAVVAGSSAWNGFPSRIMAGSPVPGISSKPTSNFTSTPFNCS